MAVALRSVGQAVLDGGVVGGVVGAFEFRGRMAGAVDRLQLAGVGRPSCRRQGYVYNLILIRNYLVIVKMNGETPP